MIRLCYKTGRLGAQGHRTVYSPAAPRAHTQELSALAEADHTLLPSHACFISVMRMGVTQSIDGWNRDLQTPERLTLGPFDRRKLSTVQESELTKSLTDILYEDTDQLSQEASQVPQSTVKELLTLAQSRVDAWFELLKVDQNLAIEVNWEEVGTQEKTVPKTQSPFWRYVVAVTALLITGMLGLHLIRPVAPTSSVTAIDQTPPNSAGDQIHDESYLVRYFEACASESVKAAYTSDSRRISYIQARLGGKLLPQEADLDEYLAKELGVEKADAPSSYAGFCSQKRKLNEFAQHIIATSEPLANIKLTPPNNTLIRAMTELYSIYEQNPPVDIDLPLPMFSAFEERVLKDQEFVRAFCLETNYDVIIEFFRDGDMFDAVKKTSELMLSSKNLIDCE